MIFNILVVTKYEWGSRKEKHDEIRKILLQENNGITDVRFTVWERTLPVPLRYRDRFGKVRIKESWFEEHISREAKLKGFNVAVFQFSEEDGAKWGLDKGHRAANFKDGDFFGECWVKCGEHSRRMYQTKDGQKKRNTYTVDIPHEIGHELKLQGLTNINVHDYDYQSATNDIEGFYKDIRITKKGEQRSLLGRILDLKNIFMPPIKDDVLYTEATRHLNIDASPDDLARDEIGCAESVSCIIQKVFPDFPVITGTYTLLEKLEKDFRFEKTFHNRFSQVPKGTIILCATVPGKPFPGHVGIFGTENTIMSNDSRKEYLGKFLSNYTLGSWYKRWVEWGKYDVHYFKLKS